MAASHGDSLHDGEEESQSSLLRGISDPANQKLPRSLTFINGLAIVIGVQIGSGIFTSPSTVLENISSPVSAILVWLVAGFLAWTGAASFIELGALIPRNGGIQEYLRYCYNDACACTATWTLLFIVKPCSIAMVSIIFAEYLFNAFGSDNPAQAWYTKAIALVALATMTLLNYIGTRVSARVANFFLVVKLLGLGSIVITGLTLGLSQSNNTAEGPSTHQDKYQWDNQTRENTGPHVDEGQWATAGMYTDAILAAMWAYSGWETLGYVGGEIQDARNNIPRVLNNAMAIVVSSYVLANMAYIIVLPSDLLRHTDTIALDYGKQLFGRSGEIFFCWIVTLSCLGALDIKVLTLGRLSQAAVQRNYLPSVLDLKKQTRQNNTARLLPFGVSEDEQLISIWLYAFNFALATAYIIAGSFRSLLIFAGMADNALCWATVLGVLVLRSGQRADQPNDGLPVYHTALFNPIAFCAASGFVVIRSALKHQLQGLILLCFLGGGMTAIRLVKSR